MGLTLALHLVAAALIVAFLVGPVTVATLPGVLAEVWMAQLAYPTHRDGYQRAGGAR